VRGGEGRSDEQTYYIATLHSTITNDTPLIASLLVCRVHLPLIVPSEWSSTSKVGIECGGQKRVWEEGKCVVLDDSYVHRVWNDTEEARVVLLVDIWHPDVTGEERRSTEEMWDYSRSMGWMK